MIYPRVNLLNKSEQRYQGIVSKGFMLLCATGVPLIIIGLVVSIYLINSISIKSDLASSQVLLDSLEPRVKVYKQESLDLITGEKVLGLFDGWESSQLSFSDLLNNLQDAVPGSVQFSRLSIRSGASKAVYTSPEELQVVYDLTIDGTAFGDEAETQVLLLQKDLRDADLLGSTFNTIKLASMKNQGGSVRSFKLSGTSKDGGAK